MGKLPSEVTHPFLNVSILEPSWPFPSYFSHHTTTAWPQEAAAQLPITSAL